MHHDTYEHRCAHPHYETSTNPVVSGRKSERWSRKHESTVPFEEPTPHHHHWTRDRSTVPRDVADDVLHDPLHLVHPVRHHPPSSTLPLRHAFIERYRQRAATSHYDTISIYRPYEEFRDTTGVSAECAAKRRALPESSLIRTCKQRFQHPP
jgi:hypothetical protein